MKIKMNFITSLCLFFPAILLAQSPVSGFMKNKGEGAAVVSYSYEKYDKVFLVPAEVDGVPVFNEVSVSSISLYGEFGITDNFDVVVNVPYIKAKGNATEQFAANNGFENERKGIQDLKIYGKYRFKSFGFEKSNLDLIGALGLQTPLGDYAANEGVQSIIAIGNQSTSVTAMGIAMFKTNSGLFTSGQLGYSIRGNDVPNALLSELKIGYAASAFYVDTFIANQLSDKDGVDILQEGFTGFFPETRVNSTRIGLNAFIPVNSGLGITGGVNSYIEGRNLGKATGFYGGLAYSF
jgi:hypothetical protein